MHFSNSRWRPFESIGKRIFVGAGLLDLVRKRLTAMPLPAVIAGYAPRCSARSRTTGSRCWNPAAFGMATCRYHGARRPQTVRKGEEHPRYKNGRETQQAKQQRSQALARIALYEEVLAQAGQLCGPRTRGPKPKERPAAKPSSKDQASSAAKPPARTNLWVSGLQQGRKQMLAGQMR